MLVGNPALLVGDYTNPISKPETTEIARRRGRWRRGAAAADAQIEMAFSDPIAAVPQVRAVWIKAYGVTTKTRLAARLETLRSGANTHRRSAGGTCVISLAPRWKVT